MAAKRQPRADNGKFRKATPRGGKPTTKTTPLPKKLVPSKSPWAKKPVVRKTSR